MKFHATVQSIGCDSSGGANFCAYPFIEKAPFGTSGFGLYAGGPLQLSNYILNTLDVDTVQYYFAANYILNLLAVLIGNSRSSNFGLLDHDSCKKTPDCRLSAAILVFGLRSE